MTIVQLQLQLLNSDGRIKLLVLSLLWLRQSSSLRAQKDPVCALQNPHNNITPPQTTWNP